MRQHAHEPLEEDQMEYRTLGQTGIQVSTQCLGAMMFGLWGNPDHDDSIGVIHAALDAGINFIDTADVYSNGESEEIVGKALRGRRDDVVLATKVHGAMNSDGGSDPNRQGNSRRWIRMEVENSLRRLQTDWIDLYQIHRPDPTLDVDETLGVLTDLVREGKVRAIGSSTFPAEQIVEAQWTAERRGRERFRCEQPPYSILARGIERSVLPTCARYGMGVIVWSPLNGGWLSGKYRRGQAWPEGSRGAMGLFSAPEKQHNQRKFDAVEQLEKVAADAGLSMTHLAIAWTLEHPAVTSTIIGPKTMAQLTDLLGADGVRLDTGVLDRIDEIVAPGVTLVARDDGYEPPELAPGARRRS
jgi:aryl-alcohol dehydrogenase-like predicted oxidoreductase